MDICVPINVFAVLAEFALLSMSSKCKRNTIGAIFSDGEQNVLEYNEWFVGTTDTQICSKNLSKMIYPLDKVSLLWHVWIVAFFYPRAPFIMVCIDIFT